MSDCPVCNSPLALPEAGTGSDTTGYDCPWCGRFELTRTLVASLPHLKATAPDAEAKLSHFLRRAQERGEPARLRTYTAEAVLKHPLPRPREQADLLVRWLAQNLPGPGEPEMVGFATHGSIIGAKSPAGFALVLNHLVATGLVAIKVQAGPGEALVALTFDGWEHYERLREGGVVYRKAFMAMKFGDAQLNRVLEDVFKPSVKRAGFDLIKSDDEPTAGLLDNRIRVQIQASDFVIADLTHDNLGAYWEAGYAEGLGKPVIYTCEKARFALAQTHFDTNHHLTILWDADAPEAAGIELAATVRATLPHLARLGDDGA